MRAAAVHQGRARRLPRVRILAHGFLRGNEVLMDRERLKRCLEQVQAYRASGLKAKVWAQATGVARWAAANW